jgi:hypothetical protein
MRIKVLSIEENLIRLATMLVDVTTTRTKARQVRGGNSRSLHPKNYSQQSFLLLVPLIRF